MAVKIISYNTPYVCNLNCKGCYLKPYMQYENISTNSKKILFEYLEKYPEASLIIDISTNEQSYSHANKVIKEARKHTPKRSISIVINYNDNLNESLPIIMNGLDKIDEILISNNPANFQDKTHHKETSILCQKYAQEVNTIFTIDNEPLKEIEDAIIMADDAYYEIFLLPIIDKEEVTKMTRTKRLMSIIKNITMKANVRLSNCMSSFGTETCALKSDGYIEITGTNVETKCPYHLYDACQRGKGHVNKKTL